MILCHHRTRQENQSSFYPEFSTHSANLLATSTVTLIGEVLLTYSLLVCLMPRCPALLHPPEQPSDSIKQIFCVLFLKNETYSQVQMVYEALPFSIVISSTAVEGDAKSNFVPFLKDSAYISQVIHRTVSTRKGVWIGDIVLSKGISPWRFQSQAYDQMQRSTFDFTYNLAGALGGAVTPPLSNGFG